MRLPQRRIFRLVEQRESHILLIAVNPFGWELLVIGLAKKEVPMLFSLRFLWNPRPKKASKISAAIFSTASTSLFKLTFKV